jgi:hypothetical protein
MWYVFFKRVWMFHTTLYPAHQLKNFWGDGISFRSFVPSFFMVVAVMPGSFVLGFMLGNLLFWLIPSARRVFDAEASGYPGTSFREAMSALVKLCVWTLLPGLLVAFACAYLLKSLK